MCMMIGIIQKAVKFPCSLIHLDSEIYFIMKVLFLQNNQPLLIFEMKVRALHESKHHSLCLPHKSIVSLIPFKQTSTF